MQKLMTQVAGQYGLSLRSCLAPCLNRKNMSQDSVYITMYCMFVRKRQRTNGLCH